MNFSNLKPLDPKDAARVEQILAWCMRDMARLLATKRWKLRLDELQQLTGR